MLLIRYYVVKVDFQVYRLHTNNILFSLNFKYLQNVYNNKNYYRLLCTTTKISTFQNSIG